MSTLPDRLADLAGTAPTEGPAGATAPELWDRGRRYGRRRRAGSAALALGLVVGLATGVLALAPGRESGIQPAGESAGLRLPDRLFHPSPWAPGTDGTGPIGPLVAVLGAERASWSGSSNGVAGVTPAGEYAFLDLEDRADDRLALSADGRHLAYWYTDPERPELADGDASGSVAAVGVAVLDTVSGEVLRHPVETRLGLMPMPLAWAGRLLWVPVWQYDERSSGEGSARASSRLRQVLGWDVATGEVVEHEGRGVLAQIGDAPVWGERLVGLRQRDVLAVDSAGRRERVARLREPVEGPPAIDPSGSWLAVLGDTDPTGESSDGAEPVRVARMPEQPGGTLTLTTLAGPRVDRLVGWRSERELVTQRYASGGSVYESVDVETGARTTLLTPPAQTWTPSELIAADALAAPLLDAPAPPSRRDPRVLLVAGLGLALLAAAGGLTWRRRVRA